MSLSAGGKLKALEDREVIGLVPAGGRAVRVAPLPCSKEIYPLGFRRVGEKAEYRCKAVCLHLLESMRLAGIRKGFVILREGKWDIPSYLGDGGLVDMNLAYLMMDLPYGVPFTLDQAYPFVRDATVALGFPDILFNPPAVFECLLKEQAKRESDAVLGLFPAPNPSKMDMVEFDEYGRVLDIQIKPERTQLRYTWIVAVWTPRLTQFMHEYLTILKSQDAVRGDKGCLQSREWHMSDVLLAALKEGLRLESVLFPEGTCLDIGTPDDLMKASMMSVVG